MKNLRRSKREFLVLIERDEDDMLIASVPSLTGCHTQAWDIPTLITRIKEAVQLCLECQKTPIPNLKFVGIQEIDV